MSAPPNPAKEGLERGYDLLKLTVTLATGALVFSAGLTAEKVDLSGVSGLLLLSAWVLLGIGAAAGILALLAIPLMLGKSNYDLEDQFLIWPTRVHQIALLLGVLLLGFALAASLVRATQRPKETPPAAKAPQVVSTLGPELIGSFADFASGSADLDMKREAVDREMKQVIERWTQGRRSGKTGILLIIGSSDRIPLGANTRRRTTRMSV